MLQIGTVPQFVDKFDCGEIRLNFSYWKNEHNAPQYTSCIKLERLLIPNIGHNNVSLTIILLVERNLVSVMVSQ